MATNNSINKGTNLFFTRINELNFAAGSSTYTPTSGTQYILVRIIGGGGGGGGVSGGTIAQASASTGGGGGGYCEEYYSIASLGATAAVVVGAGGAGATAGNNNGTVGGTSTFTPAGAGAVLTAAGGGGGTGCAQSAAAQYVAGSLGGVASGAQININGQSSGNSFTLAMGALAFASGGGDSAMGSGAPHVALISTNGLNGAAGTRYGTGGSGSAQIAFSNVAANQGTQGICIIIEYIS